MNPAPSNGLLALDAEGLYRELARGVRQLMRPDTRLVGITSGGAWLAERAQKDLGLAGEAGVISSAMHRDDYASRGLAATAQTRLDFDVNGAHILLLDDVLYTGRTIRAVLNELFDYGRPATVSTERRWSPWRRAYRPADRRRPPRPTGPRRSCRTGWSRCSNTGCRGR